jgi:hypothetical protein
MLVAAGLPPPSKRSRIEDESGATKVLHLRWPLVELADDRTPTAPDCTVRGDANGVGELTVELRRRGACEWRWYKRPGLHDETAVLYVVRAYAQKGMTLDEVAAEIGRIRERWPTSMLIVDGANRQAVETIRARYGLPLQAADKTGKADFIRAMNTDLEMGRVRLVRSAATALRDEWATLVWDRAKSLPTELASCSNHCADAALYVWRHARAYLGKAPSPRLSEEERIDALWERRQRESEDEAAYA